MQSSCTMFMKHYTHSQAELNQAGFVNLNDTIKAREVINNTNSGQPLACQLVTHLTDSLITDG